MEEEKKLYQNKNIIAILTGILGMPYDKIRENIHLLEIYQKFYRILEEYSEDDIKVLNATLNKLKLFDADTAIYTLSVPTDIKDKFNEFKHELGKLQLFIITTNCQKVKDALNAEMDELKKQKADLEKKVNELESEIVKLKEALGKGDPNAKKMIAELQEKLKEEQDKLKEMTSFTNELIERLRKKMEILNTFQERVREVEEVKKGGNLDPYHRKYLKYKAKYLSLRK